MNTQKETRTAVNDPGFEKNNEHTELTNNTISANESIEIERALVFLHPDPDDVSEICIIGPEIKKSKLFVGGFAAGSNPVVTGWFKDKRNAAALASQADSNVRPKGIYVTLNPVGSALLSRANERLKPGIGRTVDADINHLRNLLIDIDPSRPKDTNSTEAEKAAALAVAVQVQDYLTAQGWPEPAVLDSGNGQHLIYKVRLENIPEIVELLKKCLHALGDMFDMEGVGIDRGVFNSARLTKLYGTMTRKGDHTDDRPQRRSSIISLPEKPEVVSIDMLRALATQSPEKEKHDHDLEAASLKFSNLSDRIQKLIETGVPEEGKSRSEAIATVLTALVGAGATDDEIRKIFNDYPIGDKAREKGSGSDKWLAGQIEHARCYVVENPAPKKKEKKSVADALVGLVPDDGLFHSPDGSAFCDLESNGHRETLPVRSKDFRDWLSYKFYSRFQRVAAGQALKDALGTIAGKAQFKGKCRDVFVRIAGSGNCIFFDPGSEDWDVIEIDSEGYRFRPSAPVRFWRPRGLMETARPEGDGNILELKNLLNLDSDATFKLIVGWLLCALRPTGPYPVLVLNGEQGTAKSTAARILRRIIDPNVADLRTTARSEQDLVIAARNGWIIAFDNLSVVRDWLSDGLCRMSTGGGFGARELYSDTDEILINVMRPVIINGIEDVCARGDLADRAIRAEMPVIPSSKRITEAELNRRFNAVRPGIMAGLLAAVSSGLRHIDEVKLPCLPRMADAAIWWCACERSGVLPWGEGGILDAFTGSRKSMVQDFVDNDPVSFEVNKLITDGKIFTGTTADLLRVLTDQRGEGADRRFWPATARALAGRLKRAAPFLRESGIEIKRPARTGTARIIEIVKHENTSIRPSQSSRPSQLSHENEKFIDNNSLCDNGMGDGMEIFSDGCDDTESKPLPNSSIPSSKEIEEKQSNILFYDDHDGYDDKKRDIYGDDNDVEYF